MRSGFAIAGVLVLALSGAADAASPQSQGFRKLEGAAIRQAFAGKSFGDEVHFAYDYKRNGDRVGTSMGKKTTSKWRVVKNELCLDEGRGETCYIVWKKSALVRLAIGGGDSDLTIDGFLR